MSGVPLPSRIYPLPLSDITTIIPTYRIVCSCFYLFLISLSLIFYECGNISISKLCECWYCCDWDVRLSISPSVTLTSIHSKRTKIWSWLLHQGIVWINQVYREIRQGSSRSRVLNETWVGTNWQFSPFKPPYLRNGGRYDQGYYWSLTVNRIYVFSIGTEINNLGWPWAAILHTVLHYTRIFRNPAPAVQHKSLNEERTRTVSMNSSFCHKGLCGYCRGGSLEKGIMWE